MAKTYNNKSDFIKVLASMNHNEINDYIKRYRKKPKLVQMFTLVDKK